MTIYIEKTALLGISKLSASHELAQEQPQKPVEPQQEFTLRVVGATAKATIYWVDWNFA